MVHCRTLILLLGCLLVIGARGVAVETLVHLDMSNARDATRADKGSFSGVLPPEVIPDFLGWNRSEVTSERREEDGRRFLRFDVIRHNEQVLLQFLRGGSLRFATPGYYEMRVVSRSEKPIIARVRQGPEPYRTFWEGYTPKGGGWHENRFVFFLKEQPREELADPADLTVFIALPPGISDIASVDVQTSDGQAFRDFNSAAIQRPPKGVANFFRTSRFPLGLQAGWRFAAGENLAVADAGNPGPSGAPALKVTSPTWLFSLFSEPFQSDDPTVPNRVSFAYKGDGHWEMGIVKTVTWTGETALAPQIVMDRPAGDATGWKTAEITFVPDPTAKGFCLSFRGKGTLYLDSLMACSGEGAKPYASAGACEIALAPAPATLSESRLVFTDEPAKLLYAATGDITASVLHGRVVDIHGEARDLPAVAVAKNGTLDWGAVAPAPLGAFRIEAWAERGGARISPINEIVMTRVRRPRYWGKDAPDSPFGDHAWPDARSIAVLKAAGVNWARTHDCLPDATGWGWVEPEKDHWVFPDDKVAIFRNAHVMLQGLIGTAPKWASYYADGAVPSSGYFDLFYQPKDLDAFRRYVRTVAEHYRGVITEYNFQNEPYASGFWHKGYNAATTAFVAGDTPREDYAALARVAYAELRQANPDARLTSYGGWAPEALRSSDGLEYHVYTGSPCLFAGDQAELDHRTQVEAVRGIADGEAKPFQLTEANPLTIEFGGYSEGRSRYSGLYKNVLPWTSTDETERLADQTCRFIISHLALRVRRIFLYNEIASHHAHDVNLVNPPAYPVLLGPDGFPHPTLAAYSNMAWLLEDHAFTARVPVGDQVWAYLFTDGAETVAVISGTDKGTVTLPALTDATVLDLFGNPVRGAATYHGRILYVVSRRPADQLAAALAPR